MADLACGDTGNVVARHQELRERFRSFQWETAVCLENISTGQDNLDASLRVADAKLDHASNELCSLVAKTDQQRELDEVREWSAAVGFQNRCLREAIKAAPETLARLQDEVQVLVDRVEADGAFSAIKPFKYGHCGSGATGGCSSQTVLTGAEKIKGASGCDSIFSSSVVESVTDGGGGPRSVGASARVRRASAEGSSREGTISLKSLGALRLIQLPSSAPAARARLPAQKAATMADVIGGDRVGRFL
eukprot:TRINITY_DN50998_c0_g1_i1.p1 TRINITY_DN50998_c0_g1~~TRINITY_DN50998_c0_g1_i1.p1  ORF type:complete len:248 (+),score=43.60 TRINITY_DN50998_c0_g1_i1:166-909(+)